uniref:Mas-related G-protein coupled receptor member X2 n=1 Tax=Rhinopithecus bieti TaxID=61621 RepID=A0A2K6N212_RHIBE
MDPIIPALGTSQTPINESEETPCYKLTLILTVLTCIISLVGLTGNAVVLWLLGFRMRRNAVSTYILNLAAADFLFLSGHVIYLPLCLINITHTIRKILICVMIFPYLTGLSMLSGKQDSSLCAHVHSCGLSDFIAIAWLIVLCVVLCGSSLVLLVRILCGSRKMPLTRLYVTILLTVLVFLLCGLPFGIQWALFFRIHLNWNVLRCHVHLVSMFLSALNSSANPITYFFVGSFRQRQNRQNPKLVLQRALQDTPEVDEGGRRLPEETLELSGSRSEQ